MARFELRDLESARKFVGELAYTEWGREQLAKKFRALASLLVHRQADTSGEESIHPMESLEETKARARNAALKEEVQFLKVREKQLLEDLEESGRLRVKWLDLNHELSDQCDVLADELTRCQQANTSKTDQILRLKAQLYDYMVMENE